MTFVDTAATLPWRELVLGGQKSGKTRRAELYARQWLQADAAHEAIYVATGQAWDEEMRMRIARHQADRAERVPGMRTEAAPLELAQVVRRCSNPQTLLVVDCLTMWLTNWMMPMQEENPGFVQEFQGQRALFLDALAASAGPVIVVGNEIGLGVIPMGREVRAFVDALGVLNQDVAAACTHVTLMAAGLPLRLK